MGEKRSGASKVMWNFGQYTSVHAWPRIIQTKSRAAKVIWCLIFIVAVAMFAFSISSMLTNYLSYPTVQKTHVERHGYLKFPSVTVCNANPLRRSKLTGTLATKYGDTPTRKKRSVQGSSSFNTKMEFLTLVAGLTEAERKAMEHQKKDLIIQCTYDGKACEEKDFVYHHDALYGACYTYNKEMEKKATRLGPFSGLELMLNIEQGEYLNGFTATSGAVVAFHASDTLPPIQERPLYISPGTQTSVTLSQHVTLSLPAPYGACQTGASPIEECKNECLASTIEEKCGCQSPMYGTGEKICGTDESECVAEAMMTDPMNCECPSPCEETLFKYTTTSTKWPTQNYQSTLEEAVAGISDSLDASIANGTLGENVLNLKVGFQRLEVEKTEDFVAYDATTLLKQIGITSVIFIGCSVISFIELLELIFLLIASVTCKKGN